MKKRLLPCLLCLALLLAGCGGPGPGGASAADMPPESVQEPTDSLTVYLGDYGTEAYIGRLRREFEQSHPDVALEIIVANTDTNAEEATKLATELAAGRGPDLYIGRGDEFKDFYKVLNTGVFCDLAPYLEQLERLDRTDYVENMLDAGLYRGKQYFVPLTWYYPGVFTTQEALDRAGIDRESLETYSDFLRTARGFSDTHGGKNAFYFSDVGYSFLMGAGVSYLNYETLETNLDTPEFREMIDAYKLIYPQDWVGLEFDFERFRLERQAFSLQNGAHAFTNRYCPDMDLDTLTLHFSFFTHRETPLVLPLPTIDGKIDARLGLFAAVNANSPNKANAAEMIGLLLQEGLQESISANQIPIHKEAILRRIKKLRQQKSASVDYEADDGTILATSQIITPEEEEYLVQALSHVDSAYVLQPHALAMIFNDMEPYFKDEQSYDDCLRKLQSDLAIYISE